MPRLVVAAPASGHGKTTVATGLMAALRRTGQVVSGHKVGPDFIDPGYHALATGRPGRNLDPHLVGEQRIAPLLLHGARTPTAADVAVIEGVMGLFDGALGTEGFASTAHVARLVGAPVLLVADASHTSRTLAAVLHGLATFDPQVRVSGVILNKVASPRHETELRDAIQQSGIPILGCLPRDAGVEAPSRHLGLVPAAERDDAAAALDLLADRIAEYVDLDAVLDLARSAPPLAAEPWDPAVEVTTVPGEPVIAVAAGRSFTFSYAETRELLEAAGCRVVTFDPMIDSSLPPGTQGLYLGGGFPETHAATLTANRAMRDQLAEAVSAGMPTVAECAGLLYLAGGVDGHDLSGVLAARATMRGRLTLGYRTAVAPQDSLLTRAGERVTAHEFHRSSIAPTHGDQAAWVWQTGPAGWASPTLHASYLHVHWAGFPQMAERFAQAAAAYEPSAAGVSTSSTDESGWTGDSGSTGGGIRADDLAFHGDREESTGLLGFAVNVDDAPRPDWLDRALRDAHDQIHRYPDPAMARGAVSAAHARPPREVLLTNGAAEAFHLLALMRPWRRPVVVHPQFTEPDAALVAVGHHVTRAILTEENGFRLSDGDVPEDADLVVVGNPTNPTGALHSRDQLLGLCRPGRVVVVDEAFMDAVPGESESLAGHSLDGVVVIRSLTKSYAIPAVRAGYVLGPAALIEQLGRHQPPWSVNGLALAAAVACSRPEARAHVHRRAMERVADRDRLVTGLRAIGLDVVPSEAPFVLVRHAPGLRGALRARGIAVRTASTFPGLTADDVRIAVRGEPACGRLLAACGEVVGGASTRDGGDG